MTAIPGYVLVGGASRRMGRPKALIPWGDTVLAAHLAAVLEAGGALRPHLVGNLPGLEGRGWPLLPEPAHPGHHPLHGVAAALEHARGAGAALALLAPCDLIALEPAHVALLLGAGGPVVASSEDGVHPLLAVLPVDLAGPARLTAAEGGSVRAFVAKLPVLSLPLAALRNANHPEDLAPRGP